MTKFYEYFFFITITLVISVTLNLIIDKYIRFPNKPYTIVFETVTDADVKKCRSDDNCMDIMQLDELPEVDFNKLNGGKHGGTK